MSEQGRSGVDFAALLPSRLQAPGTRAFIWTGMGSMLLLLAAATLTAKGATIFVARQGGYTATAACLIGSTPCLPDLSSLHRQALKDAIARAIEKQIAWTRFNVDVHIVNQASDGGYTAVGWIASAPENSLIWRNREHFVAQLERRCAEPDCWVIKGVNLNGRTLSIRAAP